MSNPQKLREFLLDSNNIYGCANFEIDTPITRYAIYLIILLRWLFAFSGFDLPTRLPVAFFLALALALWAKGFFLFATIYKGVRF